MKTVVVIENAIQRTYGLTLEQNQNGVGIAIPLAKLIPDEIKDKKGTYTLTIEFEEKDE